MNQQEAAAAAYTPFADWAVGFLIDYLLFILRPKSNDWTGDSKEKLWDTKKVLFLKQGENK